MKQKKIIAAGLALLLVLGGCTRSQTSDEAALLQSEKIIEAVVNKDTAALKEMFCNHIRDTHDLDSEIADFFDFIDGEIISYDTPRGGISSKSTVPTGTKKMRFGGQTENVKTDSGKTYMIGFNSYYVYTENQDYIGVIFIGVQDVDTYDEETGYKEILIGEEL